MKPIRYGQRERWTDAFHGWRDGRAGIPARPPTGAAPGPVTTPHREALIRQAQDAFGFEHLHYQRLVAEPHRRVMAERARLEAAKSALAWAELNLDGARPLSLVETSRRRFGEESHPETVIVQRRRKEHQKLLARGEAVVLRAQADMAAIEADLAQAMQEAEQHQRAARTRVERIHEHIHRRLAVYRRALVRAHPEGAWANAVLSVPSPEIPGWALPDAHGPQSVPLPTVVPETDGEPPPPDADEALATIIDLDHPITRFGCYDPAESAAAGEQGDIAGDIGYVTITAPIAAPWHFTIEQAGDRLLLRTRGYEHGPYIGDAIAGTVFLNPGDAFDFAEYRYTMQSVHRLERLRLGKCDLIAAGLGAVSGAKARLTEMSFVQRENSLLAILGPSGAGKSSLFAALLGELPLQSGHLFFQDMSMATESGQIRKRLGFVPQQTDLHPSITVAATLRYGFGLRSPAGKRARDKAVTHALEVVDLEDQRDQMLSTLSGGQLRRVSIALELLTDPPLLMLDEPTSGLDANMDRQIMRFLREHAHPKDEGDEGHTVIVVTHATEHLSLADQVLVVVKDGAPAYSGPPRQTRRHFKCTSYADLMDMLIREHRTWAERYRTGRMAKEAEREAKELIARQAAEPRQPARSRPAVGHRIPRAAVRKFGVLLRRQSGLMMCRGLTKNARDRTWLDQARNGLIVSLPLLIAAGSAALAAMVAGSPGLGAQPSAAGPTSLMLLTTLCVLSGQALAYSDVVNELPIIKREFRAGVSAVQVLLTKWLVYSVIAVAQAGLITVVFCAVPNRAPQRGVLYGPETDLFLSLAALSVTAMTLGLLVSTMAAKLEHAVALVTLTSIVQIALNGVTSDLSQPSFIPGLAALFPDRWGLAAAASAVDLQGINARHPTQVSPDALWHHSTGQWLWDVAVLGVLCVLLFALAVWRLNRRLRPPRSAPRSQGIESWGCAAWDLPGVHVRPEVDSD
ncbi:MAG: ATP-binding cassette domain-containing protein [Streptosporangiaceae bacterium]